MLSARWYCVTKTESALDRCSKLVHSNEADDATKMETMLDNAGNAVFA